jgi:hypothetical protein
MLVFYAHFPPVSHALYTNGIATELRHTVRCNNLHSFRAQSTAACSSSACKQHEQFTNFASPDEAIFGQKLETSSKDVRRRSRWCVAPSLQPTRSALESQAIRPGPVGGRAGSIWNPKTVEITSGKRRSDRVRRDIVIAWSARHRVRPLTAKTESIPSRHVGQTKGVLS